MSLPPDSSTDTTSAEHAEGLSTGDDLLASSQHQFDLAKIPAAHLIEEIRRVPLADSDEELTAVKITGASGQHHSLMRLAHPVRLQIDGSLGDYAFALNHDTVIRANGNVGMGVGEGMTGGAIRVRGDAGDAAGTAMSGGTLAIYGNAGHRLGATMRGGGIFVRGDVGNDCGYAAIAGTIVIGGDAGENLGHGMGDVTVFIRGSAKSVAPHMVETPLRQREHLRLGLLLINAKIRGVSKDFRRVVCRSVLEAEEAKRGEINPSWR